MRSLCVWILLIKEAFGSISITVEPSVVLIGKSDIDIRCIVDATNLKSILSIELNRSNETVVGITRKGVAWKDAALENRTGITINDSTSIVPSYLHLMISKTAVRYPEDFGSYQCSLSAINSHGGLINDYSKTVNLTGSMPESCGTFPDLLVEKQNNLICSPSSLNSSSGSQAYPSAIMDFVENSNLSTLSEEVPYHCFPSLSACDVGSQLDRLNNEEKDCNSRTKSRGKGNPNKKLNGLKKRQNQSKAFSRSTSLTEKTTILVTYLVKEKSRNPGIFGKT